MQLHTENAMVLLMVALLIGGFEGLFPSVSNLRR